MTVIFIGQKDAPKKIQRRIRRVIVELIKNHEARKFYVGSNEGFDAMVVNELRKLKYLLPFIEYHVVPAFLPSDGYTSDHPIEFPYGIKKLPKRYAVKIRNKWMLDNADVVVTYITHGWSGAAKFVQLAERKKKTVINLYQ